MNTTIMIVDDEIFIRLGLQSCIEWEQYGYNVIAQAANGIEALSKIEEHHPHIILTDLYMDQMDGFELITICQKKYPNIKIIVLSNYNDYENVRRAMKLGASDYLLKLTVKPQEILQVLDNVHNQIFSVPPATSDSSNATSSTTDLIKTLIHNSYPNKQELHHKLQHFNFNVDIGAPMQLLLISIDNFRFYQKTSFFKDVHLSKYSISNILFDVLSSHFVMDIFEYEQDFLIVLLNVPRDKSSITPSNLLNLIATCDDYIHRYINVHISSAISEYFSDISNFSIAFSQASELISMRFWDSKSTRLFSCDYDVRTEISHILLDNFSQALLSGFPSETPHILENCDENLIRSTILKKVQQICSADKDGTSMDSVNQKILYYSRLTDIIHCIRTSVYHFPQVKQGKHQKDILCALEFINRNFSCNLTVTQLSSLLHMSESSFIHVFKEYTSYTFTGYITHIRMETAKQLLHDTALSVTEISAHIGFDNANYFSATFKKYSGMSPIEYRRAMIIQ